MPRLDFIKRFLKYYFSAQTKYHIHSPFVYEFCEQILEDDRIYYAFYDLEVFRELLESNQTKIKITDLGAGSQINNSNTRTIGNITKHSATHAIFCRIFFRLIENYQLKNILEIGTSMGIATLYQNRAAKTGKIVTLEGCENIANQAIRNFQRMKANNIELLVGEFEKTLPNALSKFEQLDYVFFDGNHRKEPTLNYFHQCIEKAHENSIFIIDDNHWSIEMEAAWEEIKQHPKVTLTIDLFFCGIVFFRKEQRQKEHFKLIKSTWKPWGIGMRDLLRG